MADALRLSRLSKDIDLRKQVLSENIAGEIVALFRISVISTVTLTGALALIDSLFIGVRVIQPTDRLVTEHVLMAIIGASIIQVGAAIAAIVYSLFPRAQPEADKDEALGE